MCLRGKTSPQPFHAIGVAGSNVFLASEDKILNIILRKHKNQVF